MYSFKTAELTVESEDEINWTLDGEFGGSVKKAEIQNIKTGFSIYRNMGLDKI